MWPFCDVRIYPVVFSLWFIACLIISLLEFVMFGFCETTLYFMYVFDTLRPRQNGRHFADDTLKCIFLNESVWIPIEILLKFVPKGPIDNIPHWFR